MNEGLRDAYRQARCSGDGLMPRTVLDYDDQIRLRDAVLDVHSILEPSHRRMYVEAVRSLIAAPLPLADRGDARHDVWEIVAACASYRGGLHCLAYVLRDFLGDSDAVVSLIQLVGTLESRWLLESRDRARLRRLLEHRSRQDFLLGLAASGMPFPVDGLDLPRQAEVVIDRLEESAPPREDHPLLRFVDGVAHGSPNTSTAVDLHQWISALGKRLRFSEIGLRELCEQSELVRDQYLMDAGSSPRTGRQARNPGKRAPIASAHSDSRVSEHLATVFLSYAHADKPLARALRDELVAKGCRVWIDEGELRLGDSLLESISEALGQVDFVIALVSNASINSNWCRKELSLAMTGEIGGRGVTVLPLRVENSPMPESLRDKLYLDVTQDDVSAAVDQIVRNIARHLAPIEALPPRRRRDGS